MLTKRGRERRLGLVWLRTAGFLLIVGSGLMAVQAIVLPTQWELQFGHKQWRITSTLRSGLSPHFWFVVTIERETWQQLNTPFYHRLYGGTKWSRRWILVGVDGVDSVEDILPRIKLDCDTAWFRYLYVRIEIPYVFTLVIGLAMLWLYRRLARSRAVGFPVTPGSTGPDQAASAE